MNLARKQQLQQLVMARTENNHSRANLTRNILGQKLQSIICPQKTKPEFTAN